VVGLMPEQLLLATSNCPAYKQNCLSPVRKPPSGLRFLLRQLPTCILVGIAPSDLNSSALPSEHAALR
jgi:hypothetical protein